MENDVLKDIAAPNLTYVDGVMCAHGALLQADFFLWFFFSFLFLLLSLRSIRFNLVYK